MIVVDTEARRGDGADGAERPALRANAIVNVRFATSQVAGRAAELDAGGTPA